MNRVTGLCHIQGLFVDALLTRLLTYPKSCRISFHRHCKQRNPWSLTPQPSGSNLGVETG